MCRSLPFQRSRSGLLAGFNQLSMTVDSDHSGLQRWLKNDVEVQSGAFIPFLRSNRSKTRLFRRLHRFLLLQKHWNPGSACGLPLPSHLTIYKLNANPEPFHSVFATASPVAEVRTSMCGMVGVLFADSPRTRGPGRAVSDGAEPRPPRPLPPSRSPSCSHGVPALPTCDGSAPLRCPGSRAAW